MSTKTLPRSGNVCQACGKDRGKRTTGWSSFPGRDADTGEDRTGWTCEECPEWSEPIRRIESRGSARFRVVLDTSAKGQPRQQVTRTLDTLSEARAFVGTTREQVTRGTFSRDDVATLCARWLAALDAEGMRPVTVQGYRTALRPVLAALGDRHVAEVRPRDVRDWMTWASREGGVRGGPLTPRSVRYGRAAAALAFDLALQDEAIASNPWRKVKPPKDDAEELDEDAAPEHWTREQVARFREVSDRDAFAGVFRLSIAGMTRADLHGLRWDSDIDMDAGTVSVARGRVALSGGGSSVGKPKSSARRRTLPIEEVEPGTMALLKRLRAAQAENRLRAGAAWVDSGYVIVDEVGAPMHPERYSERFRKLSAEAGLPPIRLHAFRHSLASWFDAIGVPPSAGAAWLGHTLAVYLQVYFPERGAEGIAQAAEIMTRTRVA